MLIMELRQYQVNDFFFFSKGSGIPNLLTVNVSFSFHSTNFIKLLLSILGKRKIIFEFLKFLISLRMLNS